MLLGLCFVILFFKQKTAYEMRISDWSSDVCSSDLAWVTALEGTGARVRDTRKTIPGWRDLEKYAVRCGGGVNHRHSLSDMALVKDNHVIAAGGVVPA